MVDSLKGSSAGDFIFDQSKVQTSQTKFQAKQSQLEQKIRFLGELSNNSTSTNSQPNIDIKA